MAAAVASAAMPGSHAITLTQGDLAAMRARIAPETITDSDKRRRYLKSLSDDRVSHWPNTLEATRMKKQNWKLEKEQKLEEARVQIDRCAPIARVLMLLPADNLSF